MTKVDVYIGDRRLGDDTGPAAIALRDLIGALASRRGFRVLPTAPFIVPIDAHDIIECSTSGSTGNPKIIRRGMESWRASFAINRRMFGYDANDRVAVFGALAHSLALYGVMEALDSGIGVHLLSEMRPKTQMAQLAAHRVTILYATPTQLRLLPEDAVPSVRLVLCGGGTMDAATRDRVGRMFPNADLRVFYGASETSFITLADAQTPTGSVGRPYPGVTLDIRAGGEIWVQSPYLFDCYAHGSSASVKWDKGFITVGETGFIDDNGYLFLQGRRDRMVTIADRNAHPEALEQFLATRFPTQLSAVGTRTDTLRGHILIAYIQEGQVPFDHATLRDDISATLGSHMVPRHIILVPTFPLLPSGKPDFATLAEHYKWP